MSLPDGVRIPLLNLSDRVMAAIPRRPCTRENLQRARMVAHRGAHDLSRENTLEAFQRAVDLGIWGVEFDVRWTKCGTPIIHHDVNTRRVFEQDIEVTKVDFATLRARVPQIPSLAEAIALIGGRCHLMIEIKGPARDIPPAHWSRLAETLQPLKAVEDYHLMTLKNEILAQTPLQPLNAWLSIAELNVNDQSKLVAERSLGGVTGHYLVVKDQHIRAQHRIGSKVGTGFVNSLSVLRREINRGVDWIFTDDAADLVKLWTDEVKLVESEN